MNEPIELRLPCTHGRAGDATWCDDPGQLPPVTGPRLLVGGDFCPGSRSPQDDAWLSPDLAPREALLPALARASDASVVNLECPLGRGTAPRKSGPSLRAGAAWADLLAACGIGAVSLANNHAMDQGRAGLDATLAAVSGAGMQHVGAGIDLASASAALVMRARDLRISLLAVAEHESGIAGHQTPGVAPLDPFSAPRRIREARAESDVVVVLVHGGNESYALPRPGLRAACRALVDVGADAVVCCHSHMVGSAEWYGGAPIVYGLGNLYFPWPGASDPASWQVGVCVVLELGEERALRLVPTTFDSDRQGVRAVAREASGRLAAEVESLSARTADDQELAEAWEGFTREHRLHYLTVLLGLTRPERLALRAGIWPGWRLPRRHLPDVLNAIRCESHREALLDLLEEEDRGR